MPILRSRIRAGGFSLIEIMVGLAIGVIGVIVVMQIFADAEKQKRVVTGGGDAQTTGALALKTLQSDIRQSGWGIRSFGLVGCSLSLRPGVTRVPLAPVVINPPIDPADPSGNPVIPPGDTNTDTLLVIYGDGDTGPEGDGINAQPPSAAAPPEGSPALGYAPAPWDIYSVQTSASFAAGDQVVAAPRNRPDPCVLSLASVVNVGRGNILNVIVAAGAGQANMANGRLYNLGRAPRVLAYAVRGGNLTVCDYRANDCGAEANANDGAVWLPIAGGVVGLNAQYGRDTRTPLPPPDPVMNAVPAVVDTYDQSTPPSAVPAPVNPALNTVQCGWARIASVRLALAARSDQYDKEEVTASAPAWAGGAIDLSEVSNWKHYRYKLFQTVVPLRNFAWMGAQTGC
jgi:type IV pilus assembly protein PilW